MEPQTTPKANLTTDTGELIQLINEATAPLTGDDYFRSLVSRLADSLRVDVALVTECLDYPSTHVRTLAYYEGGKYNENIEFDVVGTPCEDVISGGDFCFHPENVSRMFPEWAAEEGGIESFIGIPVLAPSDGRIIGHIAVFNQRPLRERVVVESMFRIIAARAGAEMQRLQAEQARRDSEQAARRHLAELAHVSRLGSLGEMASAVAHEINQPITAIMTYCRTCLKLHEQGRAEPEQLLEAMERIMGSAERTTEMVRKLREYVKQGKPRREPVAVEDLLNECSVLIESETHHNNVALSMQCASGLPRVLADALLVQQVVLNLVRNAIDAMKAAGTADRRIAIRAEAGDADMITVTVSDNGPGVSEAIAGRLFDPFVSSREGGMGIGLSLCRSIIEDHGGRLRLEHSDTQGATFCFSLPYQA